MYKDIVISFLGAWILRDVFRTTEVGEQIAIVMGLAAMLFIFFAFLRGSGRKMAEIQPESTGSGGEPGTVERRWKR